MTAPPVATAPPAPTASPSAGQVAMRRWRRARGVLIAVLALVVVGVLLAALRPQGGGPEYLDPESPGQQGSRALVQIVGARGVPVKVVRSVPDVAEQLRATPDAILVVVRSERLIPTQLDTLRGLPGDRLLVEPTSQVLAKLAPKVTTAGGAFDDTPAPGCSLRAATLAGDIELEGAEPFEAPTEATRCYLSAGKPHLVQMAVEGHTVTALSSGGLLTNRRLTSHGNAALGMNLLQSRSTAIWLVPPLPAPGTGEKSFRDLIPFGVKLAVLQVLIAVVLVALWRARRLGPVVAEPLPVVVRSAEAVEGRARLYRSQRARDRAADALRAGALERLVPLLGLSKSTAQDPAAHAEIVTSIAARTGHDQAMIGSALYGPVPADDAGLVQLADYLDDLERQVRTS